jgi:hypothetical protein
MTMNVFYTALFSVLFGGLAWAVVGAVLNVVIPVIALILCCAWLGSVYYEIAYWLPLFTGSVVAGLTLIAARRAFDSAA